MLKQKVYNEIILKSENAVGVLLIKVETNLIQLMNQYLIRNIENLDTLSVLK